MNLRRLFCWWTLLSHVFWIVLPSMLVLSPSVAAAATLCGANTSALQPTPVINEFMPDPASGTEWVELFNPHDTPITIGGMKIDDVAGNSSTPKLIPAGTVLGAHQFYVHSISGFMLNNDTDAVRLLDPTDAQITCKTYIGGAKGWSWSRMIDGVGLWHSVGAATPGAANPLPDQSPLLINEFVPLPASGLPWIELRNVGLGLIDLEGLTIDDADDDQQALTITEPSVIAPDARSLLVFDLPAGLLGESDGLRLLQPDQSLLDVQ